MMNYDGLLSQLTDDKLNLFQPPTAEVQDDTVEEEQVATIQTVQVPTAAITSTSNIDTTAKTCGVTKSESCTPQRKISTSRFMNAFQQLYSGSSNSNTNVPSNSSTSANTAAIGITTSITTTDENEASSINAAGRTPTKGVESKLLSMWHNVKYGWSGKLKSNFSKEQPVWLLGRCYHRKFTPPSSMESSVEMTNSSTSATNNSTTADSKVLSYAVNAYETIQNVLPTVSGSAAAASLTQIYPPQVNEIVVPQELGMDAAENQVAENPWEEGIEGFRRDFYSRLWMTYRREFPIMNGSNYTSDCGWGCMLRSGQMLLAQGLICHFLGRSWRFDPETQLHSTYEDNMHKKIIKWFGDSSSKSSPFSIHALVSLGEEMGKKPGDWYGPASVSYLLKQAFKNAALENADFDNITIYVAKDCTIYMQDVEDECCIPEQKSKHKVPWNKTTRKQEIQATPEKQQHWKSLIVLIPLRLGTEKLNSAYAHCLKLLLSTEYCIGIIGGRPKHSLYFVGFQEDKLIHLDPHYCQEMVDVNQENFPAQSFHCKSPRKLKTSKIDPSCCIGFYCQTKADFDNFVESVQLYLHPIRCASGTIDKILPSSQKIPNIVSADNGTADINYPLFTFSRGRCMYYEKDETNDESPYKPLQRQDLGCTHDDEDDETEEFVLL